MVKYWTELAKAYIDKGLTLEEALAKVPPRYREAVRKELEGYTGTEA